LEIPIELISRIVPKIILSENMSEIRPREKFPLQEVSEKLLLIEDPTSTIYLGFAK